MSYELVFNYLIMVLFVVNAVQFLLRGLYADFLYWVFAAGITAVVTWGYNR